MQWTLQGSKLFAYTTLFRSGCNHDVLARCDGATQDKAPQLRASNIEMDDGEVGKVHCRHGQIGKAHVRTPVTPRHLITYLTDEESARGNRNSSDHRRAKCAR